MTVYEAFLRLGARPVESREDVFDIEVTLPDGDDLWPEAAVAAVSLAGWLEDAETDADLDEGLVHFQMCHSAEVLGTETWFREIAEVIEGVCREIEAHGHADGLVAV